MKRILVTGAAGFIGSHLVELLLERGFDVVAFVRYDSKSIHPWLKSVSNHPSLKVYRGDVRDFDSVVRAMNGCDTVMHLAALIGIPYSYESPLAYVRTNIEGTYNILEGARTLGVHNVVVTSTSETYGSAQYVPIDEKHPAVGQSPYAATKIAADQIALSYHKSFGLGVKVIRPFNTYGPRQSSRAVIPTIISQILAGSRRIRLGNLSATRDLTYVTDTALGFLNVAQSASCVGRAVNLGVGSEISIGELVGIIAQRLGESVEVEVEASRLRPKASEVDRLLSNNTLVRELAGWLPQVSITDGLDSTIDWMKAHQSFYEPNSYSI